MNETTEADRDLVDRIHSLVTGMAAAGKFRGISEACACQQEFADCAMPIIAEAHAEEREAVRELWEADGEYDMAGAEWACVQEYGRPMERDMRQAHIRRNKALGRVEALFGFDKEGEG